MQYLSPRKCQIRVVYPLKARFKERSYAGERKTLRTQFYILNICGAQNFKMVLIASFMRTKRHYKCHKRIQRDNNVYHRPNHQKKKFKNFYVFQYFFQNELKKYICFNFTTKTLKYHFDLTLTCTNVFQNTETKNILGKCHFCQRNIGTDPR